MDTGGAGNHITINTTGNVTLIGITLHGLGLGTNGIPVTKVGLLPVNVAVDGYRNDGLQMTGQATSPSTIPGSRAAGQMGLEVNNASAQVFARNSGSTSLHLM